MRLRLLVTCLILIATTAIRPALADDEQEVRAILGQKVATVAVAGNWAMADLGTIDSGSVELVLLHRYKGQWSRMAGAGNMTRGELLAIGMPIPTAYSFGLGEVPPEVGQQLRGAMEKAGFKHSNFNIVTSQNAFLAYTANDMKADGYQVWIYNASKKWVKLFWVEPKTTQAATDAIFQKNGIPKFIEYRVLIGRGEQL